MEIKFKKKNICYTGALLLILAGLLLTSEGRNAQVKPLLTNEFTHCYHLVNISGYNMVQMVQLYSQSFMEGPDVYCLHTNDPLDTEEMSETCAKIQTLKNTPGTCEIFPRFNITYSVISEDISCEASFCPTLEGNKQKIDSYKFCKADPYLKQLESHIGTTSSEILIQAEGSFRIEIPVFVTGTSSNHFQEALIMLNELDKIVRPSYPTSKLYFFDFGLRNSEVIQIKEICNCTVLEFPFERFPPHVRCMFSYTWKPLVIKIMLQTYRFVMWMDTSVRFKTLNLDPLFSQAKQQGVMSVHGGHVLATHMHEDTFQFLQEPPCLYRNLTEFYGTFLLFHSDNKLAYDYIFTPWLKCALIEGCMKTRHPTGGKLLYCPEKHDKYHACHRYDQAVLSLLIYRLYQNSYINHQIDEKYVTFERL